MNTLTPIAPLSKTIRRNNESQLGYARLLAPTIKPSNENRTRLTKTQAQRLLTGAINPASGAFSLLIQRSRVTRQQIESALLSFLFLSIAITFGFLMTA